MPKFGLFVSISNLLFGAGWLTTMVTILLLVALESYARRDTQLFEQLFVPGKRQQWAVRSEVICFWAPIPSRAMSMPRAKYLIVSARITCTAAAILLAAPVVAWFLNA
jgi:hypothetical protein